MAITIYAIMYTRNSFKILTRMLGMCSMHTEHILHVHFVCVWVLLFFFHSGWRLNELARLVRIIVVVSFIPSNKHAWFRRQKNIGKQNMNEYLSIAKTRSDSAVKLAPCILISNELRLYFMLDILSHPICRYCSLSWENSNFLFLFKIIMLSMSSQVRESFVLRFYFCIWLCLMLVSNADDVAKCARHSCTLWINTYVINSYSLWQTGCVDCSLIFIWKNFTHHIEPLKRTRSLYLFIYLFIFLIVKVVQRVP